MIIWINFSGELIPTFKTEYQEAGCGRVIVEPRSKIQNRSHKLIRIGVISIIVSLCYDLSVELDYLPISSSIDQ